MRLKRVKAQDSSQALQLVKEALGGNAVILSTRSINDEVEMIAATDYDESLISKGQSFDSLLKDEEEVIIGEATEDLNVESTAVKNVTDEVKLLRDMIESQLAGLTWQGISKHNPLQVIVLKKLVTIGFEIEVAEKLVCGISQSMSERGAWDSVKTKLSKSLSFTKKDLIDLGGAYFFIGPTGVGKTTTIAKLAARECLKYGEENCGVINFDSSRMAATEQLTSFAKILRVSVHNASDVEGLNHAMQKLRNKKLILIDSAGFNPKKDKLSHLLSSIDDCDFSIEPIMVLAATTQSNILEKALNQYKERSSKRVILTKTDETFTIANALSSLVKVKTPLLYLSSGQAIPEDLTLATEYQLLTMLNASLKNVKEESSQSFNQLVASLIKGEPHV